MSRSGYSDDCENVELWRTTVRNAIRGKRGQALLRDLAAALDAMPEKRLITAELQDTAGDFCTLGVLGNVRGLDLKSIDPEDRHSVAAAFNIAPALAAEIVFENDENGDHWDHAHGGFVFETPEQRWTRMRKWVADNLIESAEVTS
ncbi:hypothetical protein K6W26_22860 [Burkholderia sp. AU42008]|uniref:hypothetical protein n=1 Tax=Burkholderia TaxID=32008 RepID=UPI000B7A8172|nr:MULTISPECIES: hypothetical protein [Burkholderia]MBR8054202.1 hypothetical protein [Burkholderia vietnamiensis]MBR8234660.1 hypothetical protein [Burkholderia sp. AU32357]MBY4875897.1 hypothetical protein [Burkholderia sp. AU42008]OXI44890.1 hypothetical protein CFB49_07480 [Burkholderia sp. AU17457]